MNKNFNEAYYRTKGFEGKYSDNPIDRGGETFHGISRKFHPEWAGWEVVDYLKDNNLIYNIPSDKKYILDNLTKDFYYYNYWKNKRLDLDKVAEYFPSLAIELYDIAVNMGVNTAAMFLQRALNLLNRNEKNYKNLKVDGFVGPKTYSMINKYMKLKRVDYYIFKIVSLLKGKHYIDIIENDESQEEFIRGWVNRIKLV